jgi:molybdopterin-guanine dinucleotide biosynthesis protein A
MKRAALILAGGNARRFQLKGQEWQDKALAQLFGKPLLVYAVENSREVVDEIVVCVNDEARKARYMEALVRHGLDGIKFAVDEKMIHISGPNVAIMTGLKSTQAESCVTIPCDMPLLKPKIIDYMFSVAENSDVAVPMWPNSRLETLVMALKRCIVSEIVETLCSLKRPRSDDIIRGASKVLFISPLGHIRRLDPELKSFVNINHQEDLAMLQTRPSRVTVGEDLKAALFPLFVPELYRLRYASLLCQEHKFAEATSTFSLCAANLEKEKSFFWAGVCRENEGENLLLWSQQQKNATEANELDFRGKDAFLAAANNYRQEAEIQLEMGCRFLAERAWADKAWCESWAMGKPCRVRFPSKC